MIPSGRHNYYYRICSITLVAFTIMFSSLVLMHSEVYSSAEDRKQFRGELRESARNGLPNNYWSFHNYIDNVALTINLTGIDPVSNSSEVFGPIESGDELFIRDPARFFPQSNAIRGIVTSDPASAIDCIEAEVFGDGSASTGSVGDNQRLVFEASSPSLSVAFVPSEIC